MFEKTYAAEWVKNPGCNGDVWARETLDKCRAMCEKYGKSPEQLRLIGIAFPDNPNPRVWWQRTHKDIDMVRYILRRIDVAMNDAEKMIALYKNIQKKHGLWRTDFSRYLDVRCWQVARAAYLRYNTAGMRWLGMSIDDAIVKAENYISDAAQRIGLIL